MWSYYGSKSRVVHLYPTPVEDKIIEPFAGSARYALRYWEKEVLLVDKYEVIIKVWKYLQACSPKDILGLPKLTTGMELDKMGLCEEERLFLGLLAGIASTMPRNKVSAFCGEQNGRKNKMKNIANQLHKIRHWKFLHGSYEEIPNQRATWFVDPPYEFGGHAYVESNINFIALSGWARERQGQVIVCENSKGTWMDFKSMALMRGANLKYTTEAIWSNLPTAFDFQQASLF